jgi:hypothetical protein
MNRYLIERTLPGAGRLSADELQSISNTSNCVLAEMAPRAQWVHSYVMADKIVCVYLAEDEAAVRDHASRGGFPCDSVTAVSSVIDPMTAAG